MSHARPALSGAPAPLSGPSPLPSCPSAPQPRVSHEVLGPRGFFHGMPPIELGAINVETLARRPKRPTHQSKWAKPE